MLSRENRKPQVLTLLILAIVIGAGKANDIEEEEKVQTTGVLHDWGATEGYNFFVGENGIGSYIIDNKGNILHSWVQPDGLTLGGYAYLTEDGTLLRSARVPSEFFDDPPTSSGSILEFDADGTCIWEFRYSTSLYRLLRDFLVLPNGNLLASAIENYPWFDAVLKGYTGDMRSSPDGFWAETLVEVPRKGRENPEYDPNAEFKDGNFANTCKTFSDELDLVWKWRAFDHSSDYLKYSLWNINLPFTITSIDHFPGRDHILITCSPCGEVFIIDHATDSSKYSESEEGFIYRWGKPSNYGIEGEQKLDPWDANWVRDNYGWKFDKQGEGSILIFNNEDVDSEEKSSVVEITPPYKQGKYEKEKDGSFGPKDVNFKILDIQKKIKVKKEYEKYVQHDGSYGYGGGSYGYGGGNYDYKGRQYGSGGKEIYGGYGQSYGSYETVYYYDYEIEWTHFYSVFLGFVQPLPNGNIILSVSQAGSAIELEKLDMNILEYIVPVINVEGRDILKDPDTILGPNDEIPICDVFGNPCNAFVALIKYSKDFEGFKKIFKE